MKMSLTDTLVLVHHYASKCIGHDMYVTDDVTGDDRRLGDKEALLKYRDILNHCLDLIEEVVSD